jgi:hypothetical protein
MLKSTEEISRGKLNRRDCKSSREAAVATTKRGGVDGQLQRVVWDPGGFQQPGWRADAGASLQASNAPASQPTQVHSMKKERRNPLTFQILNLKFVLNVCKAGRAKVMPLSRL